MKINKRRKVITVIFSLIALVILFIGFIYLLIHRSNGKIVSAGQTRKYILYVPDSYDPSTPTPLVISMHGFADWPAHHMRVSGITDTPRTGTYLVGENVRAETSRIARADVADLILRELDENNMVGNAVTITN